MITYNPKDWWKLIFAFHKSDTFTQLFPAILGLAALTALAAYLEKEVFQLNFKNNIVFHQLVGFVLSLLLVFRTNSAYERWWEGRKILGSFNNNARNLAMKLNAFLPINEFEDRKTLRVLIGNYLVAAKEHLRDGVKFEELEEVGVYQRSYFQQYAHVPNGIQKTIYELVQSLYKSGKLDATQMILINSELQSFTDNIGACERIRNTPIPYTYSLFLKKLIFVYVFTMPLGFVQEFGYWAIPVVTMIFYAFASVELIGEEIEDPFGLDANDLPTDSIAQRIRENLLEIL